MGNGNFCCKNNNNKNDHDIYCQLFKDESKENKIKLLYKIDFNEENIRLIVSKFYENNKYKCVMCINFVLNGLLEFYKAKINESRLIVTLAISPYITDLSYMF